MGLCFGELRRRTTLAPRGWGRGTRHRLSIDPVEEATRFRLRSDRTRLPAGWVSLDGGPTDLGGFTLLVEHGDGAGENALAVRTLPALLRLPRHTTALYVKCSAGKPLPSGNFEMRELGAVRALYELGRPYLARLRRDPALAWHFAVRALAVLVRHGTRGLHQRLAVGVARADDDRYGEWVRRHDTLDDSDRAAIRRHIGTFAAAPEIAIVVAVGGGTAAALDGFVRCLRDQLYSRWQLWLVPVGFAGRAPCEAIDLRGDARVRVLPGEPTDSAALNAALAAASAHWCVRLHVEIQLAPHALYLLAADLASHPGVVMAYGDEDHIDADGTRCSPDFKSAWNPELLLSAPYLGSLVLYETELLRRVGGWRGDLGDGADWDLALRVAAEAKDLVRHVPFVLCHRAAPDGAGAVSPANVRRVLEVHVARTRLGAEVVDTQAGYRLRPCVAEPPLVSILVPTHSFVLYLRACLASIRRASYPRYEVLIIDNGSDDPSMLEYLAAVEHSGEARVLRFPGPFNFSAINNLAAAEARGEVLVLMNDDVEAIDGDWLAEMVGHALRPDVGAVGAKLYYPGDGIQHAGIVLGLCGLAGHAYRGLVESGSDDLQLWNVREVAAVSAACLAIRSELYRAVGGLDARHLGIAFNDVDLCLKLRQRGYRIIWTPHARLYHHESATRGRAPNAAMARRFRREERVMRERWRAALSADPFCNPNLSLTDPLLPPSLHRAVEKPWRKRG